MFTLFSPPKSPPKKRNAIHYHNTVEQVPVEPSVICRTRSPNRLRFLVQAMNSFSRSPIKVAPEIIVDSPKTNIVAPADHRKIMAIKMFGERQSDGEEKEIHRDVENLLVHGHVYSTKNKISTNPYDPNLSESIEDWKLGG
mmetsp:Transcript_12963/g.15490  ORF Transcript_12963/g.15490 Transcript_12963/m.15490 type:complete len:141 (-) Transcript_12963:111-533(-)